MDKDASQSHPLSDGQRVAQSLTRQVQDACILIVDDMKVMRQMLGICLERAGYKNLIFAEDGDDALKVVAEQQPDIVILDLMMPRLSGYDVCSALRSDPKTEDLPVLVQSAAETPEERNQVFRAGATDFVSKPINQPELLSRVQLHLQNRFMITELQAFERHIRTELTMARDMQRQLLPVADYIASIENHFQITIESSYQASFELGGDLWGMWRHGEDEIAFFLLDITGHGVGSALNTFRFHAHIQRLAQMLDSPAALLTSLNQQLSGELPLGQFGTMFFGLLNPRTGRLVFSGAGSPRPIWLKSSGDSTFLDSSGYPIGAVGSATYEDKDVSLQAGDSLLFYSDVMIETPLQAGKIWGEEGLLDAATSLRSSARQNTVGEGLIELFFQHLQGDLPDDLTLLALHVGQGRG